MLQQATKQGRYLEMFKSNHHEQESGVILASILIISFALIIFGTALSSLTISQYNRTTRNVVMMNTTQVAEAGIEQTITELNQNDSFAGYTTEQVFFNDSVQGRGVFQTSVENTANSNAKTITSTAKVFAHNSSTNPKSTRVIKVTVVGTGSDGYSVFSGPGGLILGGSANVTNSDVFVNGTITMNGASKIGTNAQPVNVNVAHQACPTGSSPGPTYPQVCTSGQPISLAYSTTIYGTVCATNQTSTGPNPSGNILPGVSGLGLKPNCVTPPGEIPNYDKATHVASVTTTGAGNNNTYVCNSWPFNRTWPANLKLTGNVNIGGSCNVTINGNTYITGDFTLGGAAKIRVSETLGNTRPVILVDGKITVGGSAQTIANSYGTGIHFVSMKSSGSCNPNCTTLTGNDLKTSQALETVQVGGGVSLPGMIFQANWGKLTLNGSGSIGAAVGQTVDMSGAGNIAFGTELSSGERTWTVTSYQQLYSAN